MTENEPTPSKYYRTRGGDWVFYVGKARGAIWIYENRSGEYMQYETPTRYYDKTTNIDDIVGEWDDLARP